MRPAWEEQEWLHGESRQRVGGVRKVRNQDSGPRARGTVSGELRAGAEFQVMLKGENLALRKEDWSSLEEPIQNNKNGEDVCGEAKTGEDDAKDEAEGEPKKLPDGGMGGVGRAEEPQEEPGLHLGGSSGQGRL